MRHRVDTSVMGVRLRCARSLRGDRHGCDETVAEVAADAATGDVRLGMGPRESSGSRAVASSQRADRHSECNHLGESAGSTGAAEALTSTPNRPPRRRSATHRPSSPPRARFQSARPCSRRQGPRLVCLPLRKTPSARRREASTKTVPRSIAMAQPRRRLSTSEEWEKRRRRVGNRRAPAHRARGHAPRHAREARRSTDPAGLSTERVVARQPPTQSPRVRSASTKSAAPWTSSVSPPHARALAQESGPERRGRLARWQSCAHPPRSFATARAATSRARRRAGRAPLQAVRPWRQTTPGERRQSQPRRRTPDHTPRQPFDGTDGATARLVRPNQWPDTPRLDVSPPASRSARLRRGIASSRRSRGSTPLAEAGFRAARAHAPPTPPTACSRQRQVRRSGRRRRADRSCLAIALGAPAARTTGPMRARPIRGRLPATPPAPHDRF